MEFPYYKVTDFPQHQKRERMLPWIRFGIFNPKNTSEVVYPLGLIDSGADLTIIHHEFGEELGFDIERGRKVEIVGMGGGRITAYLHQVGFMLSDINGREEPIFYEGLVAFTDRDFPKTMPQQTAILGTMGFFERLEVTFRYPEFIFIKPK